MTTLHSLQVLAERRRIAWSFRICYRRAHVSQGDGGVRARHEGEMQRHPTQREPATWHPCSLQDQASLGAGFSARQRATRGSSTTEDAGRRSSATWPSSSGAVTTSRPSTTSLTQRPARPLPCARASRCGLASTREARSNRCRRPHVHRKQRRGRHRHQSSRSPPSPRSAARGICRRQ